MAEQSSTVATFRAIVMLICLILIPVAAFCGGSFPAVLKAIQSGRCPTLADFRGPSGPPASQPQEAPRFKPSQAAGPMAATDSSLLPATAQGENAQSPVIAANYNAPINTPQQDRPGLSTTFPQGKDAGIGPSRGLFPVQAGSGTLLPLDRQATTSHFDDPAYQAGSGGKVSRDDQLKLVLERLGRLGATYFVLESCGDEKRQFRFFCQMSIGGNPRVTKPFWSLDGDPLKAITGVLKQVEDWQRAGG
jgi:hypothetical protein